MMSRPDHVTQGPVIIVITDQLEEQHILTT